VQSVSGEPGAERGENGHAARDGCAKREAATVRAGELKQVRAMAAMSCLLAVTTDLPAFKALRTSSSAGVKPPISSMMMSASGV